MDLSVIVLNWNTRALLETSLHTLQRPQPGLAFEVIVADNGSADGSQAMVCAQFPDVQLLINPDNPGFGAGNNRAIPLTTGRYILFLNSDTEVEEGALARLVAYADAHPDIGIVGPKLLNGDGSLQYSCRRFPNLATGFFRNTPLGRLFPQNRSVTDYLMQDWDHATPRDVDWVSGAALMIRRTTLEQVGAFDEEFYMYCEDVDLCWRAGHAPHGLNNSFGTEQATNAQSETGLSAEPFASGHTAGTNWRVAYYPDSIIYHLIGKSSDMVPTRMTYEFHRSQYLFYKKHYAAQTPWWLRPVIPVGIALRAVGKLIRYRLVYWQRRLRGQHHPIKTNTSGS